MKIFTFFVLSMISSMVLAAEVEIKGHWVYRSDECKSGAKPNDRWSALAYKNINLFIFDEKFVSTAVFQTSDFSATCNGAVEGIFNLDGNKFVQTIKVVNQGNLAQCGIQIQSPVNTPTIWTYEIRGKTLRQNKALGGESICGKDGDLVEVYERSL